MIRLFSFAAALLIAGPAQAFDLQGHRGARGLAPENTLEAFGAALAIGVTTFELDVALTRDGVLVVHHDIHLNPDIARGADGNWLAARGPALHALTLAEVKRYDVGRIRPGSPYAMNFPRQKPVDGARIPALYEVFDLAKRAGADHVRFNIETKITPSSGEDTPAPEAFAQVVADEIRKAGLTSRASVQSFDWRTLVALRRIAPEIERVCLTGGNFTTTVRGGPSPWIAGLDLAQFSGSVPKLVAAAGCAVWSPAYRNVTAEAMAEAKAAGVKVLPWTVNVESDMARLIELGVDGIITDEPDKLRALLIARGMAVPPQTPPR